MLCLRINRECWHVLCGCFFFIWKQVFGGFWLISCWLQSSVVAVLCLRIKQDCWLVRFGRFCLSICCWL